VSGKLISNHAIVGNLVITSCMTGGPSDVETQIKNIFKKLRKILKHAGTSFENVIKANVYLADISDTKRYLNGVWRQDFLGKPPERTCVQAGMDPSVAAEIEMVARIPEEYVKTTHT
jgi:enamine deaminase RidA (YjgF/YER057c/UK114 family)